jgi:hypothetical protein
VNIPVRYGDKPLPWVAVFVYPVEVFLLDVTEIARPADPLFYKIFYFLSGTWQKDVTSADPRPNIKLSCCIPNKHLGLKISRLCTLKGEIKEKQFFYRQTPKVWQWTLTSTPF